MFKKLENYLFRDVAIDLGTANSLVYVSGRGVIINEPSAVTVNQKTGQILAIGQEAQRMIGRTPAYIKVVRPLVKGVVSDFEITEQLLKYFIQEARVKEKTLRIWPRVIIGLPCGVTDVEARAVKDAALGAGAHRAFLVEEPVASAIGMRLPIRQAGGNLVVDIGGGTTEVAVISLGGIVVSRSLKVAGDRLNEEVQRFIQEKYHLFIGERTAELAKIQIGSALPEKQRKEVALRGRNFITGLPEEVMASNDDIYHALHPSVESIIKAIKTVIEETPPELLSDIMSGGIYLCGGGALLRGLNKLISQEVKVPVKVIEDPLTAMVRGAGMILEHLDQFQEVLTVEPDETTPGERGLKPISSEVA
jgi:rod shape-determining protein MreB and related proteins